ncbi:MAG: hypothetical protein ACRBCK_08350 [Alphaproteobacteria bacterium]
MFKQKSAWKFFAEKRKLRYHANRIMESPSISGAIDGYNISMFTSEHSELDARSGRRLTAIEISLHSGLSLPCAIATGGMVSVVEMLDINKEYKPNFKGWDDSYIVRVDDIPYIEAYMTEDRTKKLVDLMKVDKAWIILIFLSDRGILRLDTPYPVDHPKKIDALIKQMIDVAKALELEEGEEQTLQRKKSKADAENQVLHVDDDILEDEIGFELEDDAEVEVKAETK